MYIGVYLFFGLLHIYSFDNSFPTLSLYTHYPILEGHDTGFSFPSTLKTAQLVKGLDPVDMAFIETQELLSMQGSNIREGFS